MNNERLTTRIIAMTTPEQAEQIRVLAYANRTTKGEIIRQALTEYLRSRA